MATRSIGGAGRPSGGGSHKGFPPYLLGIAIAVILGAFWLFSSTDNAPVSQDSGRLTLRIASGSENKALEPLVMEWAADAGVRVEMVYLGSVDIARSLELGKDAPYDAVWPAHSLWIAYGDGQKVVKDAESIFRMPVVLAVKRSIAARLGWIGRTDVTIDDIRQAAEAGSFRLAMTSATQSNSGASAYLGFLYALAGGPDLLTLADLEQSELKDDVRALLATVDRSSGSSGWLKTAFVENPDRFDAMFNYEAMAIEANQSFVADEREPLYLVYPTDGLAVADSPLGFVAKDGPDAAAKAEAFAGLQAFLLSEPVQQRLAGLGRRAGLIGLDVGGADRGVWNPDWGVDLGRSIAPIPTPERAVIERALELYQTDLRKPSLTIWVLDVSGSMRGAPIQELKEAMALLLDPEQARGALLSASSKDVTIVIAFNHRVAQIWKVEGAGQPELMGLLGNVKRLRADGGTDLYLALEAALKEMAVYHEEGVLFDRLPAIVAMTDGASETDGRRRFLGALKASPFGRDIPIHAIAFGDADEDQLKELTAATIGRLFIAREDLVGALRKAKGYN